MERIAYLRVSSKEQAEDSNAFEQQRNRLLQAGATRVIEDIESRRSSKRQGYKELLELIKSGAIEEVIVTRIDRIAGRVSDLYKFGELCRENGVNLKILDQNLDLATPHGKLQFNLLGAMSEWEIDLLQMRVNAGFAYMRAQGKAPSRTPFGYKRVNEKYEPNYDRYKDTNKTVWEVAKEIIETFLECHSAVQTSRKMSEKYGASINNIGDATHCDFPRQTGMRGWLESPVLRGHTAYFVADKTRPTQIIKGTHQALVTPTEADEIDRILKLNRRGEGRNKAEPAPLAGLIYCGLCGTKARALSSKKRDGSGYYRYWVCRKLYEHPPTCEKAPAIRDEVADSWVIDKLVERAQEIASATFTGIEQQEISTPEIEELKRSLQQLESLPSNQFIEEAKRNICAQINQCIIAERQKQDVNSVLMDELIVASSDPGFWSWLDDASKRRFFRRFIDRITIERGKLTSIKFRF